MRAHAPTTVIGRAGELAQLSALLGQVRSGRSAMAVIDGDPGIGKSALLAATLAEAGVTGIPVVEARADELARALPFGPLAEALNCYRGSPDPARAALAQMLAEAPGGGMLERSLRIGHEELPIHRVLEGFLGLIEEMVAGGPLVVGLEDLHWADGGTLLAVRGMVKRFTTLPLGLIVTLRSGEAPQPVRDLVGVMVDAGAERVGLGPLSDDDVRALLQHALGSDPGPGILEQVRGAGGNPLFVTELVSALGEEGAIRYEEGRADVVDRTLPPSFRHTVLQRLRSMPEVTLIAMRTASLMGEAFDAGHLAAALGRSTAQIMGDLEVAFRARILSAEGERIAFRHALVRDAIERDIPRSFARALHLDIGRALIAAGAGPIPVAMHLAKGAEKGDAEALTWIARGAEELWAYAAREAIDLASVGYDLADRTHPAWNTFMIGRVGSLYFRGQEDEAVAVYREECRAAPPEQEAGLRASLAELASNAGRIDVAIEEARTILSLEGTARDERIVASVVLAVSLLKFGRYEEAEVHATEAVRLSGASEPRSSPAAMETLAWISFGTGEVGEMVERAERVRDLQDQLWGPDEHEPGASLVYIAALGEADRIEEATAIHPQVRGQVDVMPPVHAFFSVVRGMALFFGGRWDESAVELEAAADIYDEVGRAEQVWPYPVLGLIALHRDDLVAAERWVSAGEAVLAQMGPQMGTDVLVWARALVLEAGGEANRALEAMRGGWAALDPVRASSGYRAPGVDAVRLALASGNDAFARAVTADVEAAASRARGVPSAEGAAVRCRAMVDRDPEGLVRAAELYRASGRVFERAQAFAHAAEALGAGGGRDRAVAYWKEAHAIFDSVGATREVARAEAGLRALGVRRGVRGRRGRPRSGWEAITPTERKVIELAASGMTNGAIASRLFLSPHTVATHLRHVYAKLGMTSRVELASAWSSRQT